MVFLARVSAVAGAVHVQHHVVLTAPERHRLDGGIADHQIDHDDDRTEVLGELGAAVHFFHGAGSHVQVMALHFAGGGSGALHRFHDEQVAVAPVHERLRVDVLVVFHEVEAALQTFVHDAAVVAPRQAQFWLGGGAQQRATELVEPFALDDDAGRRPGKGLDVGNRELHVFQPRRLQRLEAEHVADDRGGDVGDRTFLEQRQVVGDPAEILAGIVRHRVDPVRLGAVHVAGRQAVGPYHRPGRGRRFARHRGSRFDRIDAVLRRDAKHRQHVGFLGHVIGIPITHLGILQHAGGIAFFGVHDLYSVAVHRVLLVLAVAC